MGYNPWGLKESGTTSQLSMSMLRCAVVKNLPASAGDARAEESACKRRRCKRHELDPWVGKSPWSSK